MRGRLLTALLATVLVVASGCAGVPSSSAPQAIGTVERPAPKQLPEPNSSMNPDQTLREFLKATADPADRHAAARQFLTESASKAWDDAGSALLIDKVVFTETLSLDKVSVTMKADILGSLSDIGVFETGEGQLPDPAGSQIQRGRRTESAQADDEHSGIEQALLPLDTDLRQQDVPAIAQQLLVIHAGSL